MVFWEAAHGSNGSFGGLKMVIPMPENGSLKVVKCFFCVFEKGQSDAQQRFLEGAQPVHLGTANGSFGGLKMVTPMPKMVP